MCIKTRNWIKAAGKNGSKTYKSRYNVQYKIIIRWFLFLTSQPIKYVFIVSVEGSKLNLDISQTKLRELIESSYPNPLTIDDINK